MANLQTIEQQIIAEYGVFVGTVKNHAILAFGLALVAGWLVGHYL